MSLIAVASRRRWMPHVLLFLVVLIWSGNVIVSKLIIHDVPATQLALVRFSLGVLAFHVPLFVVLRRREPGLSLSEWQRLLLIGAGGAGPSVLLLTIGLSYAPATYTGLISLTGPPLTALMAWALFREVLGWGRALGTAIAFLGAALLVTGGQIAEPSAGLFLGAAFLIASQASWAIYILFGKPLLVRHSPLLVLSASYIFGLLSMWLLAVPIGGWDFLWTAGTWSAGVWLGVLFLALLNTGVSQLLFVLALREVSSSQALSYTYLQPAMTALMAVLALGEQLTLLTILCGLVILLGVWLVNRS